MYPRILLVNPPIYDFAAYDFWLKPYGLLQIGGALRGVAELSLFDFTDRYHPALPAFKRSDSWGRGHYYSITVPKPKTFSGVRRRFKRFGVPREAFQKFLTGKQFDFVLIGSTMTYWYPGIQEVISDLETMQPAAKIIIGGNYATLCPNHAAGLGADLLIKGTELRPLWDFLGLKPDLQQPPIWEQYQKLDYGVLKLTDGCPFCCTYCAVPRLFPNFTPRSQTKVRDEVRYLVQQGIGNLVFYDDALLFKAEEVLLPFLKWINRREISINFHTPNAMHLRYLNQRIAEHLVAAGFQSFYFGFESLSPKWQKETGGKVQASELEKAIKLLLRAGARIEDLTVYLIIGHPRTELQKLKESIHYVHSLGIRVMLSDFSPIPGTADGEACRNLINLEEPLTHNKTAFPLILLGEDKVNRLKELVKNLNQQLISFVANFS